MKLIPFFFFLTGCIHSTPVTLEHWSKCEEICSPMPVKEACVSFFEGELCSCYSGGSIKDYLEQYGREEVY